MTAVTIENQSGVTFTFQDGDVTKVTAVVVSEIEQYGMPGSDQDSAYLSDYEGVRKIITIEGVLTAATETRTDSGSTLTIQQQKDWLEDLQNGSQVAKTFTSQYENCEVITGNFRTENHVDTPLELPFVLTLYVGS